MMKLLLTTKVKLQYHDCIELKKNPFNISGQSRAEVANTAVCTADFAVLPSALSGSPH